MPITDWQRRCSGVPLSLPGGKRRGAAPRGWVPGGAAAAAPGQPPPPGRGASPRGWGRTAAGAVWNPAGGFPRVSGFGSVCNDSRRGKLMANSPLGLNTENPVTSSRIKYTHRQTRTQRGFPTWKRFQTKTQDPAPPAERAAGRPRRGSPVPPSRSAAGTRGGGGGEVGQLENAPFCL